MFGVQSYLFISPKSKLGTFILHHLHEFFKGGRGRPFSSSSSKLHTSGFETSSLKALFDLPMTWSIGRLEETWTTSGTVVVIVEQETCSTCGVRIKGLTNTSW